MAKRTPWAGRTWSASYVSQSTYRQHHACQTLADGIRSRGIGHYTKETPIGGGSLGLAQIA